MRIMLYSLKMLLPALIPSWRFFDVIAPSPRIEFAFIPNDDDAPTIWQEFRPRPARLPWTAMLGRMVCNPIWNEQLFLVSCAEQILQDLRSHGAVEIKKRIGLEIAKDGDTRSGFVQFRLRLIQRSGQQLDSQVAFVSDVFVPSQRPDQ